MTANDHKSVGLEVLKIGIAAVLTLAVREYAKEGAVPGWVWGSLVLVPVAGLTAFLRGRALEGQAVRRRLEEQTESESRRQKDEDERVRDYLDRVRIFVRGLEKAFVGHDWKATADGAHHPGFNLLVPALPNSPAEFQGFAEIHGWLGRIEDELRILRTESARDTYKRYYPYTPDSKWAPFATNCRKEVEAICDKAQADYTAAVLRRRVNATSGGAKV